MKTKKVYRNSFNHLPKDREKVWIQTAGGDDLCHFVGLKNSTPLWAPVAHNAPYHSHRMWLPFEEEKITVMPTPLWTDSRKVKPTDGQTVWATMGPGEEVHPFIFEFYNQMWRCGERPGGYLGDRFWQPRVVPVQPPKPEPMPEPARTDGWIRLGAQRPARSQEVWVATVNMGVQPARYHEVVNDYGVEWSPEGFSVAYGPEVGKNYTGKFLLWQPRQAQPAYPIL